MDFAPYTVAPTTLASITGKQCLAKIVDHADMEIPGVSSAARPLLTKAESAPFC